MMKGRRKSIFAVLLSCTIALSMSVGSAALAADDENTNPNAVEIYNVSTLEDFSAALTQGGSIKLDADITIDTRQDLIIDKAVDLDLNGHSITKTYGEINHYFMVVKDGGALTLNDSVGSGSMTASDASWGYGIQLLSNSSFTMNGGNIQTTQETLDIYTSANNVQIQMYNGTLHSTADSVMGIRGSSDVSVDIYGGLLQSEGRAGFYISGDQAGAIRFDMTGGTIEASSCNSGAIQAYQGSVITISQDAVIESKNCMAVQTQNNTELNITGGTITSTGRAAVSTSDSAVCNISGGMISCEAGTAVRAEENSQVKISGGTLEGSSSKGAIQKYSGNPTIAVTGGTFSSDVKAYVPSGLITEQNTDGSYIVKKLEIVYLDGQNGDNNHSGAEQGQAVKTLQKALEIAADGVKIVVCGTVELENSSEVSLNGVTVERADNFTEVMFQISGNTKFTIANATIDGKSVELNEGDYAYLIEIEKGAVLNIQEGANLVNNKETAVFADSAVVNMSGGSIKNNISEHDGGGMFIVGKSTVSLTGGTIEENKSNRGGGGICILDESTVTLNGAEIKNNTGDNGGGVYIEGQDGTATFLMQSGSITGNISNGHGGGIYAYYMGDPTIVEISGGIISNNVEPDEDNLETAVILSYDDENEPEGNAILKLSGSPTISGNVTLYDYTQGPFVEVTGAFTPVNPVYLEAIYATGGDTVVRYDSGVTPNTSAFTCGDGPTGLSQEGQDLKWIDLVRVRFQLVNEAGITTKTVYVMPNEVIDASKIPASASITGYTLSGWEKTDGTVWNMDTDKVTEKITLREIWTLNSPKVTVSADTRMIHEGKSVSLSADVAHDLDRVSYTYEWYKDGELLAGETKSILTANKSGSYTVKVKAVSETYISDEVESEAVILTAEDHRFDSEWKFDGTAHWYECAVCGEKKDIAEHISDNGVVTTPATETEAGVRTYSCSICGIILKTESVPALGVNHTHKFGEKWSYDGTNHWHECECGEKKDISAHISDEGVVTTKATTKKNGVKTYSCTVCGKVLKTEVIPKKAANISKNDTKTVKTNQAVKTGDTSSIWLYVILAAVSGSLLLMTIVFRRKKHK